jgi:S1-C subfamily serine protease
MSGKWRWRWLLPVISLAALGGSAWADDAAVEAEYQAVLKSHAAALVTIRYVPKSPGSSGELEGENEITGVMVEPTGLVLCSNTLLGGVRARFREGPAVPTNIRVLVGEDTEGLPATFIARDTELDLAWLQIKEPGDRKFADLDLAVAAMAGVKPKVGQRVLALGVMGRYFGREVLVSEGQVAGRTHKPRELYVVRGNLDTDPGLPVFATDGQLVGFACLQQPEAEEFAGSPANMLARGRGLILPAETVAKATARAKEVQSTGDTEPDSTDHEKAKPPGDEPEGDGG